MLTLVSHFDWLVSSWKAHHLTEFRSNEWMRIDHIEYLIGVIGKIKSLTSNSDIFFLQFCKINLKNKKNDGNKFWDEINVMKINSFSLFLRKLPNTSHGIFRNTLDALNRVMSLACVIFLSVWNIVKWNEMWLSFLRLLSQATGSLKKLTSLLLYSSLCVWEGLNRI